MLLTAVQSSRRMIGAIGVALALVVGISACGSSASSSTAAASISGGAGGTTSAQYQARLNLAKCFRAHGINVPDPSSGGGTAGGAGGIFQALRNYPRAQLQTATQACRTYFSQAFTRPNLTPAERQQRQAQLVKFAQCMRSHGVNIPDPTANGTGGGGGFGFARQFGSVDRNSPAFQTANKACASLRPQFGRGGGPGAGPPAGGSTGA